MKTVTSIISVAVLVTLAGSAGAVDPPPDGGYPGNNTAEGEEALLTLTIGKHNTALGNHALRNITDGSGNTAVGSRALRGNGRGFANTAIGYQALLINQFGAYNTAGGYNALFSNTTGTNNTAVGYSALANNRQGSYNIALGRGAGAAITKESNNIDIGNGGSAGDFNAIRIGTLDVQTNTHIAGISGVTIPDGVSVVINANGDLGTINSSARFKREIRPMAKRSELIYALDPVAFYYKAEFDLDTIPQFGLVAEEVDKVAPELVVRDKKGEPYAVRYEAVNAMLLNEFLKEHHKVEAQERRAAEQDAALTKQEGIIAEQQKQIDALTKGLQRLSEQLNNRQPVDVTREGSRE